MSGGKVVLLFSTFYNCLWAVLRCILYRPQSEFSAFQESYPLWSVFKKDTELYFWNCWRRVCDELRRRQKIVAKAVKKQQKKSACVVMTQFRPDVVVADEIGSAVASMGCASRKEFLGSCSLTVQKAVWYLFFVSSRHKVRKSDTTLWH